MSSFIRLLLFLSLAVLLGGPVLDSLNEASPLVGPILTVSPPESFAPRSPARVEPAALMGAVGPGVVGDRIWRSLEAFYSSRQFQPAWLDGNRVGRDGELLLRVLSRSDLEGLDPERYGLETLRAMRAQATGRRGEQGALPEVDARLTAAFFRYAADLLEGRITPRGASVNWGLQPEPVDLAILLQAALTERRFAQTLQELLPTHAQYVGLRAALAHYKKTAGQGEGQSIPADLRLKPGARHPAVAALRHRLHQLGDLEGTASAAAPDVFDRPTSQAVARFQARHGLKPDGALGPATVRELNVPLAERIRVLEINLERWRWLPRQLGRRHIMVNIPTFQLFAFDDGREALRMNVVTGKAGDSPTPVFTQEMTTVVFSPYWNIPPGIMQEETIPAVRRNPGYLYRNNMEVVRGTRVLHASQVNWSDPAIQVRQRPGGKNALGLVKFLLPNRYHVYLHDTPSKSLFARPRRDFSHGCVRVEKPADLARFLLDGWTPQRIQAAMRGGQERHVALSEPVPVYVSYFTAWIDDAGAAQFRRDIYGHDDPQQRLLPGNRPAPQLAKAPAAPPPAPVVAAASTSL